MGSKFSALVLASLAVMAAVRAEETLNLPSPMVAAAQRTPAAGSYLLTLGAARSAQELGLPGVATTLYRQLLTAPAGVGIDRAQVNLALVTALLDDGDVAGAEEALQTHPGDRGSAWHLRMGLVQAYQKKTEAVRADLAAVKREELEPADVGWWFFLQGALANLTGEGNPVSLYGQAEATATNQMAKARFALSGGEARLKLGRVRDADLEAARKNAEMYQGQAIGYDFARNYVIMLDASGQKAKAVAELQRHLRGLRPQEYAAADEFHLYLGLIAGPEDAVGRTALNQLLTTGRVAERQRIALQMLANSSLRGPIRPDFRKRLDELINAKPAPQILEDLLLVRARLALAEKVFDQAERDANELLQKFPGSQLKASAYAVRTTAAWEQRRYRVAVDSAEKARNELPPGQTRAELGVLVAEAWYRAGDFRSAAEAYTAALNEVPAGVLPGSLMFQRVQAEIEAARADPAQQAARLLAVQPVLDELSGNPKFDVVNRWQAEWNLARALRVSGQNEAAYARVNKLLGAASATNPALPPELRARMAWLRAFLALETGQAEQALKDTEALLAAVPENLSPELKATILSEVQLLKAQANFALGRSQAAEEGMVALRNGFPRSDAAASSYIVQADNYVQKGQLVEAQKLLTRLAEDPNLQDNANAPYALYRAANLAETLGQSEGANKLIEQLVTRYPRSDLVFTARLAQGNLLRNLNQFAQAQLTYESIINAFPQHLGVPAAQLALADAHSAQAFPDASHLQRALEIYESLLARPGISADLRVEAGYKLGRTLKLQSKEARAEDVWWKDVAHPFLIDKPDLGAKLGTGRIWIAKALLDLGDLLEKQEKLEDAKVAWLQIVKAKLPGQDLASARLARYISVEAKP
jgi:TolA-binding protein